MSEGLSASFFAGNRARLRSLFTGTAPILITANGLMQKSSDTAYPFTQDASFWYLTGISEPNIVLVMDKSREYLIVPQLSTVREFFDGALDIEKLSVQSGIADILYVKEGWQRIGSRLKKVTSVATLASPPDFIEDSGLYVNPARNKLIEKVKTFNAQIELLDLRQHLSRMRMVKQPEELIMINQAIKITTTALKRVRTKYLNGNYENEFDIELELTKAFHQQGGQGHSFTPIIAAGKKACIIHPQGNFGEVDGKPLLVDVGAQFGGYAADISRTWAVKPTKRFNDVHETVQEVADYALSILKPGIVLKKYEQAVEHFMGEKLRALGLIKTVDHDLVRSFFPHSTSHFLGIDVHDSGDYNQPLEAGVILTVEPGIYIPQEGIGVRIENDVMITADGAENLSAQLP